MSKGGIIPLFGKEGRGEILRFNVRLNHETFNNYPTYSGVIGSEKDFMKVRAKEHETQTFFATEITESSDKAKL